MAQRVAIARALSGSPEVLIADEPTTALDVTVQAEILDLLRRLQQETGMAIVLVTHDWGVVADIADRCVVMYAGEAVEIGAVAELFARPLHPYSRGLLDSSPHLSPAGARLRSLPGRVPAPAEWPRGCHFAGRCPLAAPECTAGPIPLRAPVPGRASRCLRTDELLEVTRG
jgi:peptide/nickel transport system permease protein